MILFMIISLIGFACTSSHDDNSVSNECNDMSLSDYCDDRTCRGSLYETLEGFEKWCDEKTNYERFGIAAVIVRGCNFTSIERVPSENYPYPTWFDTQTGELWGFILISDTFDCGENWPLIGERRPENCANVTNEPCSICGWNVCEYQQCSQEIGDCRFPCVSFWECSKRTGCQGDECWDETICPGFSFQGAREALGQLENLATCIENSHCEDECEVTLGL